MMCRPSSMGRHERHARLLLLLHIHLLLLHGTLLHLLLCSHEQACLLVCVELRRLALVLGTSRDVRAEREVELGDVYGIFPVDDEDDVPLALELARFAEVAVTCILDGVHVSRGDDGASSRRDERHRRVLFRRKRRVRRRVCHSDGGHGGCCVGRGWILLLYR